ncbi:MAG: hypothetical protein KIS67_16550 [Verrucomicrobiae bacterium]|nr:hypothetical protein [Verrucomicrobiae bacterium]
MAKSDCIEPLNATFRYPAWRQIQSKVFKQARSLNIDPGVAFPATASAGAVGLPEEEVNCCLRRYRSHVL